MKNKRRLDYLCNKFNLSLYKFLNNKEYPLVLELLNENCLNNKEYIELINLLINNFSSDGEAYNYWYEIQKEKKFRQLIYNKKPTIIRKDNKNYINYGNKKSNKNKIRVPKKCRKTAWKRFRKLFPNL